MVHPTSGMCACIVKVAGPLEAFLMTLNQDWSNQKGIHAKCTHDLQV